MAANTRSNGAYAFTGYATGSQAYAVNGLNQYTTINAATLTNDLNGNLTSDGTTGYSYDVENRLIATSAGVTLTYDPMGRLYRVQDAGSDEQYTYAGDQRIAMFNPYGTMIARFVFGAGEDNVLLGYNGNATTLPYALQADHQGSIVSVVDAAGNVTAYNSYDDYGVPGAGNLGRFQYTGQAWVPQVGLYYYKARFYAPKLGRFLQTDPIGYADQNNLYAYVGNDPDNLVDSSGKNTGSLFDDGGRGCGIGINTCKSIPGENQDATANRSKAKPKPVAPPSGWVPSTTIKLGYRSVHGGPDNHRDRWVIQWILSKPSKSGGWIIQRYETNTGSMGWEAWRVPPGSQYTEYYPDPNDDIFDVGNKVAVGASARFYPGLKLPSDFMKWNPNTSSGSLPSTLHDMGPFLRTQIRSDPVNRKWYHFDPDWDGL